MKYTNTYKYIKTKPKTVSINSSNWRKKEWFEQKFNLDSILEDL